MPQSRANRGQDIFQQHAKLNEVKSENDMRQSMTRAAQLALAGCVLLWTCVASADPVKLRIGYGTAAEEQLWLLIAKPCRE